MRRIPARLIGTFAAGLLIALGLLALGLLASRPARAQDLGLEISKTLRGGAEVQVGQVLEFSIRITNTGSLPLTALDLEDQFVSSIVAPVGSGPFAKPGDPPLSDTTPYNYDGAETITWSLLSGGATLDPGQAIEVIVRLRAVHPTADLQTVNRARIARAIRSNGGSSGGGQAAVPAQPAGARLPMSKSQDGLYPVAAGLPITYTIVITNDSLVDIVSLPLRDAFNPAALRFVSASPPPDTADQVGGALAWADLLASTGRGRLAPGESITVQTAYVALREITAAVNTAEVSGAKDEYGNAVNPRQAQVPIRIVGPGAGDAAPTRAPTATPTPFATAGPRLTEIAGRTATAAAQAAPTVTPTAPATAAPATATAVIPASLPNTGDAGPRPLLWLLVGLALIGLALALKK